MKTAVTINLAGKIHAILSNRILNISGMLTLNDNHLGKDLSNIILRNHTSYWSPEVLQFRGHSI